MQIDVNMLSVIIAAVASMIIGAAWYSKYFFGKQWMALSGLSQEKMEQAKKGMGKTYALAFFAQLVTAYVLSHLVYVLGNAFGDPSVMRGLSTAFWLWLGFVAPIMLGMVLWENKSWKLYGINASYWLFALLVQAAILSAWI